MKIRSLLLGLLLAWGPGSPSEAGCEGLSFEPGPSGPRPVVLVIADTLRRDRVGIYGGSAKTPELDAFAEAHLLFERASAQAPWTKPSIATLFTSLYPSQHQVASDPQLQGAFGVQRPAELTAADVLSQELVTLAEVLRDAGLETGAIVPNPWLEKRYGFAQGFDHYDDSLSSWDAGGKEVARAALDWLASLEGSRAYFLYVHFMDAHRPYGRLTHSEALAASRSAPDGRSLRARDADFARSHMRLADGRTFGEAGIEPTPLLLERAYDRGVEGFDRGLGMLLRGLRQRPDWQATTVVVTSDHGEGLFEHGYGNHGGGLFESEAAVPLVVRLPGAKPGRGRLDCLVGLVDLLPSLCEVARGTCPPDAAGRSILGPAREPGYLVTEGVMTRPRNRAIRDDHYKLLYEPEGRRDERDARGPWSFYSLDDSPLEGRDLLDEVASSPGLAKTLARLRRAMTDAVPDYVAPPPSRTPVDSDMRERLRVLGYTAD